MITLIGFSCMYYQRIEHGLNKLTQQNRGRPASRLSRRLRGLLIPETVEAGAVYQWVITHSFTILLNTVEQSRRLLCENYGLG